MSNSFDPMDCSMPGFPVLHYLPEFTQTHVHWVSDVIQPSHRLLLYSPPASVFPSIRVFCWPFSSDGQNIGASASILPMNIQGWFPLGLTGLILLSKGLSRIFSSTIVQRHQFFGAQPSLWPSSYIGTWKTIDLAIWTFVSKVMSLLFNMLSRFVRTFLPRSNCLLFFVAAVTVCSDIIGQENKICHCFHFPPSISCYEVMGLDAMILVFWILSFKPAFSLSSFTFGQEALQFLFCH